MLRREPMQTTTLKRQLLWQRRLLILSPLLLLCSPSHADSYLDALETEAQSTDVQTEEKSLIDWSRKNEDTGEKFPKGLTQEEFARLLRNAYKSLSIYYEDLSEWNRKKVYQVYQQTLSVEMVRREIKIRMTK
jgi:hypothetical protein